MALAVVDGDFGSKLGDWAMNPPADGVQLGCAVPAVRTCSGRANWPSSRKQPKEPTNFSRNGNSFSSKTAPKYANA